ncbi:MAG: DUF2207 domain-containing protein, partial [Pseudolabrys sp.]
MANEAWSGIDVQLKRNANISKFRTRPIGPRPLSPFSRPLRDDRFLDNVRSLTPAVGEGPSVHCHRPLARCSLAAEVISSFDSDVRLAKDGELTVTETVRVQAEGRDIRHGIYRDFPLTFKDAGGVIREVDFSLISVERDGRPEEYSTTASAASSASIPAAKARSFQAASTRTSSRYRTGRQVRWFDGKPELNWNVTGNFWRFPIMTASYHLQFVAGGEPPRWTAYTGRLGERGRDWRGSLGALGTLSVETTRR